MAQKLQRGKRSESMCRQSLRQRLLLSVVLLMGMSLLVFTGLQLPVYADGDKPFVDDENARLEVRIDALELHAKSLLVEQEKRELYLDKLKGSLTATKAEGNRLNSLHKVRVYTVLLSFGIDITSNITLNPIEFALTATQEYTGYQQLMSGWDAKRGAERALAAQKARDLLWAMIPGIEKEIKATEAQVAALGKQKAAAEEKASALKGKYLQIMKEPYRPSLNQEKKLKEKQAQLQEVLKLKEIPLPVVTTGFGSALEAANAAYAAYKLEPRDTLDQSSTVLPKTGWADLKKVQTTTSGHTKWVGTYYTPEYNPQGVAAWSKKAVSGGVLDVYIEAVPYKENGSTRYRAEVIKAYLPNPAFAPNALTVTAAGRVARGQWLTLKAQVVDPLKKVHQVYWFANGTKNGQPVSRYVAKGATSVLQIPVDLYGMEKLNSYSAVVVDRFMGLSTKAALISLESGVNRSHQGVNLSQAHAAVPDQPLLLIGDLTLPEYGDAKLLVDYNGEVRTFECVPTKGGAFAQAIVTAKAGVTDMKVKVDVYAGGALIGEVDWMPLTVAFDKKYVVSEELSRLQGEIGAIRSALGKIVPVVNQIKRVDYASMLKSLGMNSAYATVIVKHLAGEKDPNFQYTVSDAMNNDKLLVEYLDGLYLETGKGEQRLVSALKSMKLKGYPEGLAFIDVFYLHLKAVVLNRPALEQLILQRQTAYEQLENLERQAMGLVGKYQDTEADGLVQALSVDIRRQIDRLADGGYSPELAQSILDASSKACSDLEVRYPEFKGYVEKYRTAGASEAAMRVYVNGQRVAFANSGVMTLNGQSLVSAGFLSEALGASEAWREKDKVLSIARAGKANPLASIPNQATTGIKVFVDGKLVTLSVAPATVGGQVYVPLKAIAEKLGYRAAFDKAHNTLQLTQ